MGQSEMGHSVGSRQGKICMGLSERGSCVGARQTGDIP